MMRIRYSSWRKSVDNMMNECSTWATECEFMLNDLALNIVDYRLLVLLGWSQNEGVGSNGRGADSKGKKTKAVKISFLNVSYIQSGTAIMFEIYILFIQC